ncbi:MAG: class I SAM-dependent methyltransferase [Vicinamibacterales bacterium]
MDERINRVAALANVSRYDADATSHYADGAPHIKHASLRTLYGQLLVDVFDRAKEHTPVPRVLDLGAGEGSVTLPFLELGARVLAVDSSRTQLDALIGRCGRFGDMLHTRCEDVADTLGTAETFDIIAVNSFLHHVPDTLGLVRRAIARLAPHGQFFSFQDPLRYDSLPRPTLLFDRIAYVSWRIFRGDVLGGLARRLRRSRGAYRDDSVHDNVEYHVVRNGVDHVALMASLTQMNLECRLVPYFSTQSRLFQPVGAALGLKNTFALIARTAG